jgi:hypothetical protein
MTSSHDFLLLVYLGVCMILMNLPTRKLEKSDK